MRLSSVIGSTSLCVMILSYTSPSLSRNADYWQQMADQVTVGMSRAEVEQLFPPQPMSSGLTIIQGGSQITTYWVDPFWKVSVSYDYTGVPRNNSGKALSHESPENKVLAIPIIIREDMPKPIKLDSIKVIENTEQTHAADVDEPRR